MQLMSCQTTAPKAPERYDLQNINGYVRYMAQSRTLHAELTFKSDSTQKIAGDVLLNNQSMQFKKLPVVGFQYRQDVDRVNFVNQYTFSYLEKDGSKQEWSIGLEKFQSLTVASDGISQTKGGLLAWEGEPLKDQNDALMLLFTDSEGSTFQINHAGITKGKQFEIKDIHANRLALGKATLLVTRKRTVVEQGTPNKIGQIEYYLPAISFEVKE